MKDCPRHLPDGLVIWAIPASDATVFYEGFRSRAFDQDRRGGNCADALDTLVHAKRAFAGWAGFELYPDGMIQVCNVSHDLAQTTAGQRLRYPLLLPIQLVLEAHLIFGQCGASCL